MLTVAGSKGIHVCSLGIAAGPVVTVQAWSHSFLIWVKQERSSCLFTISSKSSNVWVTGIKCLCWATPPTLFLGKQTCKCCCPLLGCQDFPIIWNSFKSCKLIREYPMFLWAQLGQCVWKAGVRWIGEPQHHELARRLMLTETICPHFSSHNEHRRTWQGSLYHVHWKIPFWACWRARLGREVGTEAAQLPFMIGQGSEWEKHQKWPQSDCQQPEGQWPHG